MLKNADYFDRFEKNFIARSRIPRKRAFMLFDAMWKEAQALGIRSHGNRWEGLEKNIEIARILNNNKNLDKAYVKRELRKFNSSFSEKNS